jgi:hypothetical protein
MKPMPPIGVNGAIFRTLTWSRADDGRSGRDFDDDNASDLLLAVQHAIQGCKRSGWFSVQKMTRNPTTISVSENLTINVLATSAACSDAAFFASRAGSKQPLPTQSSGAGWRFALRERSHQR